jgi:hypothetical protein
MMRKITLALLLLFATTTVHAQWYAGSEVGAISKSMGHATVGWQDAWAVLQNQSGITAVENTTVGACLENPYAIKDLMNAAFFAVLPSKVGHWGISYTQAGTEGFQPWKLGATYARDFGNRVSASFQLNAQGIFRPSAASNALAATGELGIQYRPIENLSMGFHVFNFTRSKYSQYEEERHPTILRLGLMYQLGSDFMIGGEVTQDLDREAIYRIGGQYNIRELLYIRMGANTELNTITLGLGVRLDNFRVDMAVSRHSGLGLTPSLSLDYAF